MHMWKISTSFFDESKLCAGCADALETQPVDIMAVQLPQIPSVPSSSPVLPTSTLRFQYQGQPAPSSEAQVAEKTKKAKNGKGKRNSEEVASAVEALPENAAKEAKKDGDIPAVITRNDQLKFKQSKKQNRKRKTEEKKKKGKVGKDKKKNHGRKSDAKEPKKGKRELQSQPQEDAADEAKQKKSRSAKAKRKSTSSLQLGRSHRKRTILQAAGSASVPEPKAKRVRTQSKKTGQPEGEKDLKEEKGAKAECAIEGGAKGRATAKAKAKAAPKGKMTKGDEKPKPKAKAKGKAKIIPEQDSPLSNVDLMNELLDFAKKVGGHGIGVKSEKFKHGLRAELKHFDTSTYNVYWSRCACGIKLKHEKRDVHHFSYLQSMADETYKIAIAAKCAEIAVNWQL